MCIREDIGGGCNQIMFSGPQRHNNSLDTCSIAYRSEARWLYVRYAVNYTPRLTKEETGTLSMSVIMYHPWSTHTKQCARGEIFNQQLNANKKKTFPTSTERNHMRKNSKEISATHIPTARCRTSLPFAIYSTTSKRAYRITTTSESSADSLCHSAKTSPSNSWMHV